MNREPTEFDARVFRTAESLLALTDEERTSALESIDDPKLREAVDELLARDRSSTGFLDPQDDRPAPAGPDGIWIGRRLGAFRIDALLGSGGTSRVYAAHREGGPPRQEVAIKILRRSIDGLEARRRFEREQEMLVRLDHPAITRLYDVGIAVDGSPYFVMEKVRGSSIIEHCDREGWTVRQRVELFLAVLEAVQSAHQRLVVHRDLKPANILVSSEGHVKLLDFGVAGWLDPAEDSGDEATGVRPLTPNYASPEQLRGLPVGTASDVYSLGIVLYELLTGELPFDRRELWRVGGDALEAGRRVAPPSTVVSRSDAASARASSIARRRSAGVASLRRQIAGDLDAIVLRSLAYDVADRYGSVDQLADDVRRYLEDRPVRARGRAAGHALLMFVRRNRFGVAASAAVLVSLVIFAISTAIQLRRVSVAREAAELESARARAVSRLLLDAFELADPTRSSSSTLPAREVLDRAAERADRELGEQPLLRASLLVEMGIAYRGLGEFVRASELLGEAATTLDEVLGPGDDRTADAYRELALAKAEAGRFEEAEALARRALDGRLRPRPESTIEDLGPLMYSLYGQGRLEESEVAARRAVDLGRKLPRENGAQLAEALQNLSRVQDARGHWAEAEASAREGIDLLVAAHGPDDPQVTLARNNLASTMHDRGATDEAITIQVEVVQAMRQTFGDGHPQLAAALNNLGMMYQVKSRLAEAEAAHRESLAIRRRFSPTPNIAVANALNNLAVTLRDGGRLSEAEVLYVEAIEIRRALLGGEHASLAGVMHNLAQLRLARGDVEGATRAHREVLELRRRSFRPDHPDIGASCLALAKCLIAGERGGEALEFAREAVRIYGLEFDETHWRSATARSALGAALRLAGDPSGSLAELQRSHRVLVETRGADSPQAVWAAEQLARTRRLVAGESPAPDDGAQSQAP